MSDSASYNSILSQGVQDVAALLPLLGTVQCERHVSLSLQHGYLYAAFAPLSIFGSLGTALAGLWIGLASTVWGVRRLKDAGFEPSSNVAKIITLDNRRYLAESNLIAAMKGLQAQGLQDRGGHMQIKFKDQVSPWNFYLVSASLIAAAASLFPYLHFIIVHDTSSASRAWIFPAMRAMGGFFCIVGGQQLLQKRIVTIVQQRLNFMDISQFLEKEKIDVTTMSIPSPRAIWTFWNRRAPLEKVLIRWDHNKTSEACLQDLYRYLELFEWTADEDRDSEKMKKLLHHISGLPDKPTGERFHKKYLELLGEDSDSKNTVITAELFSKIYRGFYRILIFIGVMASVAGYIGCFSLVQDKKASPRGRYLWIGLEAFLALVRMMIWASNPSFDDLHGLQVCLELSDSSPHDLIMALDEKDSKVTHPTLADPIVTFRTTAPVIDRETFYDAFIKHSGFLPSLRAKSIVPYYTIFENQLCIAFESLKLDETVESVFFLDFQPNDTTPFTLYHAATTAAAAATMGTGATETETPPAEAAAEAEILEVATETAMETAATTEAAVEATAASTPTPTQTQTVTVKDRLFLVAKVKPDDPFHTKNLAPLQELVMQHHFINSVLKNKPSDLKSGHSFDVGWLVNVKHFLSRSKDPNEAWKPVRECAEKLMRKPQDMSKLIYSGNQALYFYHEKLRCYYGDETPDGVLAFHYFNQVNFFFSDYVKRVQQDITRRPLLTINRYQKESEKYMKGVDRVDKLLFSWKSWQWYRRYIPRTGYDQDDLDVTVRELAHMIWNAELYDAIADEKGLEDFKEQCKRLPEDPTPEVGAPESEVTTDPPMTIPPEGRSFFTKMFCSYTRSDSPEDRDIEAASIYSEKSEW